MLKDIFGFGKKSEAHSSTSKKETLSPNIRDAILNVVGARSIPVMPAAAQKSFALSSNPKAEARDFVEVIEVDEALSARVIKIANSVYFERGNKSSSIAEAVVVIGLNELRNLLNANALCDIFPSSHPARMQLWSHDIAVALTSKLLAKRFLPQQEDAAFLAGLMHDIGKLLLLQRSTLSYEKVLKVVEKEGKDFAEAEILEFPFNHCEVGHLIGDRWNFSQDLIDVISQHHNRSFVGDTSSPINLCKIINYADTIVNSLGLGYSPKFSRLRMSFQAPLEELWETLNIPKAEASSLLEQVKRNYETEYDLYSGNLGK